MMPPARPADRGVSRRVLVRNGVPLTAVGARLGHESLQATARYTQPSERDLRDAVNRLVFEEP